MRTSKKLSGVKKLNPNVLWIFSDQHRADTLSCYGDPNIDTPNLDRLADEGARGNNVYSNTPLCSPFRANLYTGQYITTHGVTSLFKPLLPRQPVLPQVLRENGYHTSHMGKWHLGGGDGPSHFVSPYFRPGWSDWMGWENSNEPFATEYGVGDMPSPLLKFNRFQTDALTDMTIEWLEKRLGCPEPWFHVMSIEPPHNNSSGLYEAPEPYMKLFKDKDLKYPPNFIRRPAGGKEDFDKHLRGYYALLKNLDDNVGRVLDALERNGQLENTIIMYFSDHGDMMGCHGRRQKSRPEQEASRIPFIIRWPAAVERGLVSNALMSAVDIMPTLLGLIGLGIPGSVEGTDMSPVFREEADEVNDVVLLQYERDYFSHDEDVHKAYRGILHKQWKYVVYFSRGPGQLFDLLKDPHETTNLIHEPEYSTTVREMDALLRSRCREIGDDFYERMNLAR